MGGVPEVSYLLNLRWWRERRVAGYPDIPFYNKVAQRYGAQVTVEGIAGTTFPEYHPSIGSASGYLRREVTVGHGHALIHFGEGTPSFYRALERLEKNRFGKESPPSNPERLNN